MSLREFDDAASEEESLPADLSAEEIEAAYEEGEQLTGDEKLDLRKLVFSQTRQLKAVQRHLFNVDGTPKKATESRDIRGYMTSSIQLLGMLQKFQEALSVDADFRKVEQALEMTFEEIQCPEFIETFERHLNDIRTRDDG